jgi:neutral trehalase
MTNVEGLALFDVQRRLRRKNYDFSKYIDHALFVIEDLSFNCILIRANQHLRDIATTIGKELPSELESFISKSEHALNELWDDYAQEYFSRDFVSHRLIKVSSIATLLPLYAGCITKERAHKLVSLLENEHRFGPAYPVPSVPLDSPWFLERRYWQGPTWINTNWLIIDGLKRYGYHDHAAALQESTIEMVAQNGFYEYFSPLDGKGAGTDNFSWTAALTLDLLNG